jgi:hypothetical protein
MSVLSKILGSVFSGVGVIVFLFGTNSTYPLSLVWIFLGLLTMSLGFSLITAGRATHERKPPPPTVTEIRCDSSTCDFKEIRNFEKGDYILKRLDARCPKCGSSMTVQGVYMVKEEEKEKTNV